MNAPVTPDERQLAPAARAWPFEEARKLVARIEGRVPAKGYVLFETGYGPSGLPHIGTFGEVVRTTMVRQAFRRLSDVPTRLFAFSDDMDGLRKVPDNVPNQDMLRRYLGTVGHDGIEHGGLPLTRIPDPFGCHDSFGHHNNAQLRQFLDAFGFDYEFQSSTELYTSGRFDKALLDVLGHYDAIMAIMLPTLGEERRRSYCPFLPISPRSGRVLQAPAVEVHPERGTVVFRDEEGALFETPVTGGRCKLQWRVDWPMRWHALGVDYEMSGKDLISSVEIGARICRLLGSRPPEGFNYELFLDEHGQKISKSKGNGLSVEEWLTYAPPESLALFMYQKPRAAKRLYFDVIPRTVDDYLGWLERFPRQGPAERLENPVWHIHDGRPPQAEVPISFGVLLNLVSVTNTEDPAVLWGFISRYAPGATPQTAPLLDRLVGHAIAYYRDFVKPKKRYRAPDAMERAALDDLLRTLEALPADAAAEDIQNRVYEVGKRHPFPDLRAWFKSLYETLLGQSEGPRMGSFVALYGLAETRALIRRVLAGEEPGAG
ncbi:MAG: lysine--tRNA ligase [Rhodospirillaceae bacterium]|nr:lysine--tRNA ligase [Rhodospirillaceae bacterium]